MFLLPIPSFIPHHRLHTSHHLRRVLNDISSLMLKRNDSSSRLIILPTDTGLIVIPSSLCASSGLSQTFFANTLELHNVLTKVVRPVPEAPVREMIRRTTIT